MQELKNIVCSEELRLSLATVKAYLQHKTDEISTEIDTIREELSEACKCELASEVDFNTMILRVLGQNNLFELKSLFGGFWWNEGPALQVLFTIEGDDSLVEETGIVAYNGEGAFTATIETIKEKGIKVPKAGDTIFGSSSCSYANTGIDNGNGFAYTEYATIRSQGEELTVFGEEVKYFNSSGIANYFQENDANFKVEVTQRQLPELGREFFVFSLGGQTDDIGTLWDSIHTHPNICKGLSVRINNFRRIEQITYHLNAMDMMGMPIITIYPGEVEEQYYQFVLFNVETQEILLRSIKHPITFQMLYGHSLRYFENKKFDPVDSNGRVFISDEWVTVDTKLISKNQATVSVKFKEPASEYKTSIVYISDKYEDPYYAFPVHAIPSSVSVPRITDFNDAVITREPGWGVWVGVLFEDDIRFGDSVDTPIGNMSSVPIYFTTHLKHITASEFDNFKGE